MREPITDERDAFTAIGTLAHIEVLKCMCGQPKCRHCGHKQHPHPPKMPGVEKRLDCIACGCPLEAPISDDRG